MVGARCGSTDSAIGDLSCHHTYPYGRRVIFILRLSRSPRRLASLQGRWALVSAPTACLFGSGDPSRPLRQGFFGHENWLCNRNGPDGAVVVSTRIRCRGRKRRAPKPLAACRTGREHSELLCRRPHTVCGSLAGSRGIMPGQRSQISSPRGLGHFFRYPRSHDKNEHGV